MQTMVIQGTVGGRLADRQGSGLKPVKLRTRSDSLPEYTRYRDEGCSISPSCFECPLERCRYEEPGGLRSVLNQARDREMTQMRLAGMSVAELAGHFGVSRRTVFRGIGGVKPEAGRTNGEADKEPIPIRATIERKEAYCA